MCCAGTVHSVLALHPDEAIQAREAGFDVTADGGDGQPYAALPCSHLDGTACTIYDQWRPRTCAGYHCRLQLALRDGEVSLDGALAEVARLKALIAARLPQTAGRPLRELVIEAAEKTRAGAITPENARLIAEVGVVNREIDRVIRYDHQGTFQL